MVEEEENLPNRFSLEQNFPNPFNPSTVIRYQLPEPTEVELRIYNIMEQEVRRLVAARQPDGNYAVPWDGRDGKGLNVASGVYLYRLQARRGNEVFIASKKLVLIR